jgi:hypothetical protein
MSIQADIVGRGKRVADQRRTRARRFGAGRDVVTTGGLRKARTVRYHHRVVGGLTHLPPLVGSADLQTDIGRRHDRIDTVR